MCIRDSAYTKHEEYGAVIQDPDICFGCGYCTWVCPYNAPQLDPVNGQVEKCNMCVDRLEVGLKPACVSACLGNALNFGVVENTPDKREQIDTHIPGFPSPDITQPNIRFQQTKPLAREVTRTDSMPIKYQKDDQSGNYKPTVDKKNGETKHWNWQRLSSRENPLVVFTLSTQASIGIFFTLFLGNIFAVKPLSALVLSNAYLPLLLLALALVGLGLLMSTVHLGKPMRFYRGFNNWRHSPVSREGLGIVIFMSCLGLHTLASIPDNPFIAAQFPVLQTWSNATAVLAAISGALAIPAACTALYYMYRCYRIKARPFWDHWHTAATFIGATLSLGAVVIATVGTLLLISLSQSPLALLQTAGAVLCAGIAAEIIGLYYHHRDLSGADHEGAASHYVQRTTFGKTYVMRNIVLVLNAVVAAGLCLWADNSALSLALWALLALTTVGTTVIGRALFYVLVIPTTMPGALFWKNKGFEQHARDIGLADMPQVGVAPEH